MWVFFTRRLRRWLLLAIALPLARFLVHRLAVAAARRDPDAATARGLRTADSAISSASDRTTRRRRR
jgi:hypothetical protein